MKRWWRFWLTTGVVVFIVALVATVRWILSGGDSRDALQEVLAELDRTDPGWRLQELMDARPAVPDVQNGALVAARAYALGLRSWPRPDRDDLFDDLHPTVRLSRAQDLRLRDELGRVGRAVEEARKLADRPRGRYALTFKENPNDTDLSHAMETRVLACLLKFDGWLRAQEGDLAGAAASCRAAFNAGRSLGDEPCLVSQRARGRCIGVGCRALARVLNQGELSEADLLALQRLIEDEIRHPNLRIALRGERAMAHALYEGLERGKIKLEKPWCQFGLLHNFFPENPSLGACWPSEVRADRLRMYGLMADAIESAGLPDHERRTALVVLRARASTMKDSPASRSLYGLIFVEDDFRRTRAVLQCFRVALAAERYRLRHEDWPESPARLVPDLLTEEPLDPFDGKPLRYRKRDGGIVVYSVGLHGDNDGELAALRLEPDTDLGVQLWPPAERGRPVLVGPPEPKPADPG
jgi:hypothetical protein